MRPQPGNRFVSFVRASGRGEAVRDDSAVAGGGQTFFLLLLLLLLLGRADVPGSILIDKNHKSSIKTACANFFFCLRESSTKTINHHLKQLVLKFFSCLVKRDVAGRRGTSRGRRAGRRAGRHAGRRAGSRVGRLAGPPTPSTSLSPVGWSFRYTFPN